MADEAVRLVVRDHMRASPYSEHKVVLQDYFTDGRGTVLLRAIEDGGVSRSAFLTALEQLPRIQFYIPSRVHRLTWTGGPGLLVVPASRRGRGLVGYAVSGELRIAPVSAGNPVSVTLFLLEPAEPMYRRVRSQALTPGLTIQDATDDDFGGAFVERDATGRIVRVLEFADLAGPWTSHCTPEMISCDDEPGSGPSNGTNVITIVNHGVCDNLCVGESLEFEFVAGQQSGVVTGVPSLGIWFGNVKVSGVRPYLNLVEISVRETDSWPNQDDYFSCQQFGGGWSSCPNFIPQVYVTSVGGVASFSMCEDLPWTCIHSPSDLEISFKDDPG